MGSYTLLTGTPEQNAAFDAEGITAENQPAWAPPQQPGAQRDPAAKFQAGAQAADKYAHGEPRCGVLTSSKADAMFSKAQAASAPKAVASSPSKQGFAASIKQMFNR